MVATSPKAPLLLVLLLIATACGSTTATDAVAGRPISADDSEKDLPESGPYQGSFQTFCGYSHSLQDDPIVSPGVPGASHLHDFFGNEGIDAHTTLESALADESTCAIAQDTASYWTPAMFVDDVPIEPAGSLAYYRVANGVALADVQPFPAGLMMVSGDQSSTVSQDTRVVGWSCGNSPNITSEPTGCVPGSDLRLRLIFPDCWNGADLRSLDNRHVARSTGDGCPTSHPVVLPQLEFSVSYRAPSRSEKILLASGPVTTAHGDFFNAWNQPRLENEVDRCLRRNVYC